MFPEALMLHYLDDLDSKMESMRAQFEREVGIGKRLDWLQSLSRTLITQLGEISGAKNLRGQEAFSACRQFWRTGPG